MHNLWEDDTAFDPAHHTAGRQRRNRAPTGVASLTALRAWLLHDYLVPYCRSLAATRIFRRCFWIDSIGDTRDTSIQPILQEVTAAAQQLAAQSQPVTLQMLVLQPGRGKSMAVETPQSNGGKKVGKKQRRLTEDEQETSFILPEQSEVIHADWPSVATDLLESLGQAAALFLLNLLTATLPARRERLPFLTLNDLAPLYTRTAPTELLLLLPHAQLDSRLPAALSTPEGAAALTALLRSDRWKGTLTAHMVAGLLQGAMRPHFMAVQRFAFPICVGPAMLEEAPYTLLFATRRQDSLTCMNDALCVYRRRLVEQSYQGLLNEAWFRDRQRMHLAGELQELAEDILRRGRAQAPRRWPDLRQQLLLDHFGRAQVRDYDECLSRLLEAGEVRCEWRQRPGSQQTPVPGQSERRIPGNEDVMVWHDTKKRRY
jgi:hypothetical protein